MSNKVWTPLHAHDDISNGLHYFEVSNTYSDYVKYSVDHGIKSIAITNHGTVANWISHKLEAEKAGLKFIAGEEAYVTMSLEDKSRYHTIILAKNYEGVKTLNQLSSDSFKPDHFYYKPRITFDELRYAVEKGNIYVTTACLASGLAQSFLNHDEETHRAWLDLAINNKENVFLEVQPHNNNEQKAYNQHLVELANRYGLHLIASNDIHALDEESDRIRKIIKEGKGSKYDDEDNFELWCKTYDEMFSDFEKQGVLNDSQITESLDFTNVVADSVEEFEIDRSHKYPHLYDDPEKEFQRVIREGIHKRGIDKLPKEQQKVYVERINHEYKIYKNNGSIDYMLTDKAMIDAAKEHGINVSYGRGSVSGSLIAYLTGSTEMDSVKYGLNFERFMNPERISLADVDHDWFSEDKEWIQQWLLTNDQWHAASILTLNTYGLKGAIKAIADGLPRYKGKPAYIQSIRNQIGDDGFIPNALYEEHQELIDLAKKVVGVVDSFGRHAAGIVVNTDTIEDTMGTMRVSGWNYAVSQITMHDIEYCGWVKYDVLGLDNIGLISRTAELAGIPFPTPDSDFIDFEDEAVWNSMRENNIGVFQMEGDRAGKLLSDMLSPETIRNIRSNESGKDVKYMDLLSLVNAAQRPSGASYVDAVTHGRFKDNGHPALNKFLAPTLGNLVYQEQLIQFLVEFCGRSAGEADVLRRAVGHKIKSVIDEEVPKIKEDFVKTMINVYQDTQEHAERIANDFIQVFMDAANYGFSINHSMAYSYIGYISTWLRYYYPLEWCTAAFQIWEGKQDKLNKVVNFAKEQGIELKPVKFRKSKGNYFLDKSEKFIYEGTASIKGVNGSDGDELYLLRDKEYSTFTDLLLDIYDSKKVKYKSNGIYVNVDMNTIYNNLPEEKIKLIDKSIAKPDDKYEQMVTKPIAIVSSHVINLIMLNFFEEFGKTKKLIQVYEFFKKNYKPNNKRLLGKCQKYKECLAYEKQLSNDAYPLSIQLQNELKLLGRCITKAPSTPGGYAFITDVMQRSNKAVVKLYSIKKGVEVQCFVSIKDYKQSHLNKGNIIKINSVYKRPKMTKQNGTWIRTKTNELWLNSFTIAQ